MKKTSHFVRTATRISRQRCECGWLDRRDCYLNTTRKSEWCWPCTLRHAVMRDTLKGNP